jgi:radial spoke head protein 4A
MNILISITPQQHSEEGAADSDLGDIPDIMDLASLWEWAGVSFGKEDTFLLCLSIKKLVEKQQLKSVRLWGKIYGRKANYIVAEAELKEGVEDVDEAAANSLEPVENLDTSFNTPLDSKTPTPKVKKFAPLAKENRSGLNKYIYYACHYVGGSWIRLPDVIPERLQESRKIRKYFTGVLDTKVRLYFKA